MKKRILFLAILIISINSFGQTLHVHKNDGNIISIDLSLIEKITFTIEDENSFIDPRDGNVYKTVQIGEQVWMAENLAYLPDVDQVGPENGTEEPFYYVYGYNGTSVSEAKASENYAAYGALYNYYAAATACPDGWHLSTDEDWFALEEELGMTSNILSHGLRASGDVGKQLKSTTGWFESGNGTNSSGFNALPAGNVQTVANGTRFNEIGEKALFWAPTDESDPSCEMRYMQYDNDGIYRYVHAARYGLSVRCVKD